ncbi:glycosyltransferase family 4 protein [Zunongwangia endophytica]|uniref:Glycosyltransferase family 4 protein n=1 Tax=Zunongwangia endophytica TaxID=1808945 RepID=A0ABV8HB30_9FLAO|nr:glycosyltransferase family 4 protein [Zunongwangia endophytica]MDN3595028.1 glycosyltransferase family 4 protein [Zunongwangia endophytica]
MHIGFLTPEYPHDKISHSGGLGSSLQNLVRSLQAKGIKISVFVYGQKADTEFEENGIHFYCIKQKTYKIGGFYLYRKYINRKLNYCIRDTKIDLLEVPDWTGITAFMNFTIPVIMRFHGSDTYFCHLENRPQKFKNRFFEKHAVKRVSAFIAPTTFAGVLSKELFKINDAVIKTIHYGLDLSQFDNENPENFESFSILYLGTLIRKKGVLELLDIFEKVKQSYPNSTLLLIGGDSADIKTGSSSTWKLLQQKIKEKDISGIQYLGKMPYPEVKKHIKKAHVCVFPSYAETLGMVTIESMALQKAVVNTNIGWAKEIIAHGEDGLMEHPSNHEAFAEAIKQIFEGDHFREKLQKNARLKVEANFDIQQKAIENIEFYKEILATQIYD